MSSFRSIPLVQHAARLYPLCRSLTGEGVIQTLEYFEEFFPEFKRILLPSGSQVFDWTIPPVWNVQQAYLRHIESNKIYADFALNNLHLVGYSEPKDCIMSLEDLQKHLYSLPKKPYFIPYVTSYYHRTWGFCMPDILRNSLPSGDYHVVIDSSFQPGYLHFSHALIAGRSSNEVFFSSYICHPSMANNELSGPIVLSAVLDYVRQKYPSPSYTYRFALLPETIGSISYLSKFGDHLKDHCVAGFNISCVGDDGPFSVVHSPYSDTLSDAALTAAISSEENTVHYSFLERGSDERQYCSPGMRLPMCTFTRSKFGQYMEYHTSADNLLFISESGLSTSVDKLCKIIDAFELGLYPTASMPCEPHLSKRNLYPKISSLNSNHLSFKEKLLNTLMYCDGKSSIFDIVKYVNLSLDDVIECLQTLVSHGLVQYTT